MTRSSRSDPYPGARSVRVALLFSIFLLPVAPARAVAREVAVCAAIVADVDGLSSDDLRAALLLEARKQERKAALVFVADLSDCPASTPERSVLRMMVGPGAAVALLQPAGGSSALDLERFEAVERATEVGRAVWAALPSDSDGHAEPLVDVEAPVWIAAPPRPIGGTAAPVGGLVTLAGGYVFELGPDSHWGELEAEAAVSLFEGRLSIGVGGAWAPERSDTVGRFDVRARRGDLFGVARGGGWLGPVLLRVGLGGGWEWRTVEGRVPERFAPLRSKAGASFVSLEADALYPVWEHVVVAVGVPARLYIGGVNPVWNGERFYEAARASLGIRCKVGVSF